MPTGATAGGAARSVSPVASTSRSVLRGNASASAGPIANPLASVTTPGGRHSVSQHGHQPAVATPVRGSQERQRRSTVNYTNIRAGGPTVSPVQTAIVRQRAPTPARTYGMAPVNLVRRIAPFR